MLDKYAYQYRYDHRNRCIWKKLPGCSAIHYSYDYTDRLVFSQDGNQRAAGECTFQFYDILGRETVKGICKADTIPNFPEKSLLTIRTAENGIDGCGYTLPDINIEVKKLQKVNYYDDYSYLDLPAFREKKEILSYTEMNGYDSKYINSIYPDLSAKGLMTGQCVYTTSGESLPSSFYYDVKERIVQKQSENIIQSFLSEYYQYSFTGKVQSHL